MLSNDRLILEAALSALRQSTGLTGTVVEDPADKGRQRRSVIRIGSGNDAQIFIAEIKSVDRFQTPALVKAQLANFGHTPLLVAPYITRETAEHCRAIQLPFLDTAGNAFLSSRGQFVYVIGHSRPASLRQDRFRAVNRAGLQITFALLCRPALAHATVREIARTASTSLGTVGPVIRDLEERGFIRPERRQRALVDRSRLLEEWVTHYPISLRPKLGAKRFEADPALLRGIDLGKYGAYWGGEVAAERFTGYLKPASFTVYAHRPITDMVAACRLRAAPMGNVEVLDVFWGFGPQSNHPDIVHPVLAYSDLLATHDGRNIEAAKLIYERAIAPVFRGELDLVGT